VRQLTLVAFYGEKPPELHRLLDVCQKRIAEALGSRFSPLAVHQIHATIVGLERLHEPGLKNRAMARYRGAGRDMDIPGYLEELLRGSYLPFQVRFGGFGAGDDPFRSRGERPFQRSIFLEDDKAVLIGWPVRAGAYPDTLERLRRRAQVYHILHAYHRTAEDRDNDFYLRLGTVDARSVTAAERASVERRLRDELSRAGMTVLEVGVWNLCLAAYDDETLPPGSTTVHPITLPADAHRSVAALYS
jgi:hypothetical protein